MALVAPNLQRVEAQNLQQSAQHALDDLNDFSAHHLRLSLPQGVNQADDTENSHIVEEGDQAQAAYLGTSASDETIIVRLIQSKSIGSPTALLQSHTNTLDTVYSPNMLPNSASSPSIVSSYIASELQNIFAEEQALLAPLHGAYSKHLSTEVADMLARRTTRSVKYAPSYHLTFSLFTPESSPSGWDIEAGLRDIFGPLLKALSPISNFTMDTQVQPYARLPPSVQPVYDETQKAWTLFQRDLGGFINTAEWPLSPAIGIGPTINFLLYVPSPATTPLLIHGASDNSWLVPQWGGVALHNPSPSSKAAHPAYLEAEALKPALMIFSSQLMSLLGVPSEPSRSLPMRLSTLTRVRAASLFFSASSTMGSLARLVSTLTSISIPDSVAENVAATLQHLDAACSNFKEGAFSLALENAKAAEAHAEKAFFEKSMVGQVYFPDEHKVAVYLPLLGPVAVPLVVAALREFKSVLKRREIKRG